MVAILLFVFAVASLGAGALLLKIGISSRAEARQMESLRALEFGDFTELPRGTAGYVEGPLADSNPELAHGLALYTRSTLYGHRKDEDGRKRPIWKTQDRAWPRLRVGLADGEVVLEEGYSLTLLGSDPSIVPPEKTEAGETERFEGLKPGQPVCAVGATAGSANEPILATDRLVSGTFDDARSGAASGAAFGLIAGFVMLVVGLVLGLVGTAML